MIIFGVAEEWKEASNKPTRQVVFMITKGGSVVAYDRGVMFYICPTLQDFWTANIVFEHDNAVFPLAVQKYVKQMYFDLKGFVGFYNRLRLQRVIIESKEKKMKSGRALPLRGNRLMKMLINAATSISHGNIPMIFSDRTTLHNNVNMDFLELYWKARCSASANIVRGQTKSIIESREHLRCVLCSHSVHVPPVSVGSSISCDGSTAPILELSPLQSPNAMSLPIATPPSSGPINLCVRDSMISRMPESRSLIPMPVYDPVSASLIPYSFAMRSMAKKVTDSRKRPRENEDGVPRKIVRLECIGNGDGIPMTL